MIFYKNAQVIIKKNKSNTVNMEKRLKPNQRFDGEDEDE